MLINFISYVPAIFGLLSIAVFVFLNGGNSRNNTFVCFNVAVALWLSFLLLADISSHTGPALVFLRIALFFGQLMFSAFYLFALTFPFQSKIRPVRQALFIMPNLLIAALLLTPLGLTSVSVANFGAKPQDVTFLYTFSDAVGIFYMLAGIVHILNKYRSSADVRQKKQIKYLLAGLTIAIVANILTGDVLTLLNVDSAYVDFNGFSLLIFSLMVAYAMFRHGFLDIRLIVARTTGYVMSLGTIAAVYSLLVFVVLAHFIHSNRITVATDVLYVSLAMFLAITFQPVKQFFDKFSNRLFYQDSYDTQAFLGQVNRVLASVYDLKQLLNKSAHIIQENLKVSYCFYVIVRPGEEEHLVVGTQGHPIYVPELRDLLTTAIGRQRQKVISAENLPGRFSVHKQTFRSFDISALAQLSAGIRGEPVGYIILGPKKSGNLFNSQDLNNLGILADELVIAIQNSLHFEEIQNFNLTLQAKVNDATRKLRRTNEKLKILDETKDDFISMASHQLRTPLTSIKGYLSMVQEGDAGKVNATQAKMLGQAFISSQRMVYLIADLLNVSRLKTGKFIIEATPTNLSKMVSEEIGQLVETAAGKNIELTYKQPKDFPDLMLDETKTRQVIMNFVDNAIYYTPAGGHIQVELVDEPTSVELRVVDDGIGVPRHEQHHLFTKFYRAGNAQKARPDGTGLGLFMAKKVVLAQGGSIIFESKEGQGSTFGFLFPKHKSHTVAKLPVVPEKTAVE
jgi:signal transduction histidine kinase